MFRICDQCGLPGFARVTDCPGCGRALATLPAFEGDELTGAVIEGRYRLVSFIGEGGMAWVYRGVHQEIGASVAVKLLKPMIAHNAGLLARFKKEASSTSALSHPNILSVISSGETPSGMHYMVSEFIQGMSLSALIRQEGKLALDRAVDIMRQVLVGLEEAHGLGIVHRDLKPENVMVICLRTGSDFCKIVDFGIALRRIEGEDRLTRQGEVIGTPEFMAPEIIRGLDATPATDLYAAGIMLYEMLTGVLPFRGGALTDILMKHLHQEAAPIRQLEPAVPQELENLITLALEKDPARRLSSATEFLHRLEPGPKPAAAACRTCGEPVTPDHRFCPGCGRLQVQGDPERATYKPEKRVEEAPTVERRMFTVPFFGREAELAVAREFIEGKGPCLLELEGVAGVGKRALALEAARAFGGRRRVVRVGPDRVGLRRAWLPVARLIRELGGLPERPGRPEVLALGKRLRLEAEEEGHALALFGLPAEHCDLEFRARRREMITTVVRLLRHAVEEGPVLLILADVDAWDVLSREVLERLLALPLDERVRVIATTGPGGWTQRGLPEGAVRRLRLSPFDPATAARFRRETLAANGYGGEAVENLPWSGTDGLPLHLVEGLRLLHGGINDLDRPLSDVLQTRIRNLPGATRRLLQWVSVAGGRLSGGFVRESGFLEKASVDATLDCVRHGFLSTEEDGRLELAHPLFADIILAEMPAVLRRQMLQELVEYLLAASADPRLVAACALQLGDPQATIEHLLRAADTCEAFLDDPGARHHLKLAYQYAELGARSGVGLPRFVRICLRYGDVLRHTEKPEEGERVLREALLVCPEGDPTRAQLLSSLARCLLKTAPEHAESQARRAMKLADGIGDGASLFRVCHDFGRVLARRGATDAGLAELRRGAERLSRLPEPRGPVWRLRLLEVICLRQLGRLPEATAACRRLLETPEVAGSWLAQARCHEELATLAIAASEPRTGAEHLSRVIAYNRFTGDRHGLMDAQLRLAELDPENRAAWAQGALALAELLGSDDGRARASRLLG